MKRELRATTFRARTRVVTIDVARSHDVHDPARMAKGSQINAIQRKLERLEKQLATEVIRARTEPTRVQRVRAIIDLLAKLRSRQRQLISP